MNQKQKKYGVGVVIGRFQVPRLHESHIELLNHVIENHKKVIILLGLTSTKGTRNNPLDFEMRRQMIQTDYPNINILLIEDCVSDEIWSKNVDKIINSVVTPGQSVVLYGSRDSFIPHYKGKFDTLELEADKVCSGTEVRKNASIETINTSDFRSGVTWAYHNQFPKVFTTVDVSIIKNSIEKNIVEILLARKPNENLFRFVGGFAEPDSESFELDAMREVMEETKLSVHPPKYLGSFKVKDWRYQNEVDKVKTLFFVCDYFFGSAEANDDVQEVKWFEFKQVKETDIVLEHREMFKTLVNYIEQNSNRKVN